MKNYLTLVLFFSTSLIFSQRSSISGNVKSAESGEDLIGATVFVRELGTGASTNVYGYYSIQVPDGKYTIVIQYLGFEKYEKSVEVKGNLKLNIELIPEKKSLQVVEITSEKVDANVQSTEMSTFSLPVETIKKIPAIFGEVDLVRALQLLPGVVSAGEGTGGFFVRGGRDDQNLILLDEAPVYNAQHLLGFFSVFNPDAVKDVKLYKGGIPAEYGGRLSSVLDIKMKDGNSKRLAGSGGIGLIASRLTLEGPIVKDKGSFIISGRRTYADLFLAFSPNEDIRNNQLYFYDFNTKLNYKLGEKDRIYLSGYFGRDVFLFNDFFRLNWGNATATFRWNHVFNNNLFSNFSVIYSNFDYLLGIPDGLFAFDYKARIRDINTKADFTWFVNNKNLVKFGIGMIHHTFNVGTFESRSNPPAFNSFGLPFQRALEPHLYISNDQKISTRLSLDYGLRVSLFSNIGETRFFEYADDNMTVVDTLFFRPFEPVKTYGGLEPRLSARFLIDESSSIKASYNRMYQYLHLLNNNAASSPLNIWQPSGPFIRPQFADQVAGGYFKNFKDNTFEFSVEIFYKWLYDVTDFKDNADLILNEQIELVLLQGTGRTYGVEFLFRKQRGRFTGWISYTYSKSMLTIPGINNDQPYLAPWDRPHNLSLVGSYDLSERVTLSANWVYTTGLPATLPVGQFFFQGIPVPLYSERNTDRIPDFHRLDLSVIWDLNKNKRKFEQNLNFSVYNAYYRKNIWSFNIAPREDDPFVLEVRKFWLFAIIPSITYNFNF